MGRNHLSIDAREEDANWVLGKMHPHYLLPSSPRCYPGTSPQARAVCDRAPRLSRACSLALPCAISRRRLPLRRLGPTSAGRLPGRVAMCCRRLVLVWFASFGAGLHRPGGFCGRGPVGSGSSRLVSRCGAGLCSFDCSCDFEFDALRFDGRASSSFSPLSSVSSRCRLSGCSSSRTNGGVANRSIRNGCGL